MYELLDLCKITVPLWHHLCPFTFSIAIIITWHIIYLFIICLTSTRVKFHGGRNLIPFYLPLYLYYAEYCMAHSRCSIYFLNA